MELVPITVDSQILTSWSFKQLCKKMCLQSLVYSQCHAACFVAQIYDFDLTNVTFQV